jgi:exonuclease SbcC
MAEAQKTAADADHQLQSAVQQRASAQARRDALAEQLQELEAGVADGFGDEGAVTAALDAVTEAERRLAQARRGEREQRAAHKAASSAREAAEDRLSEGWRAFDRARDAVASLGPPQASRADLLVDWQALVAWAADRLPAEEHGAAEATARAAAAAHRQDEQRAQLEKLCAGAGVELDGGRSLVEAVAEARANAAAVHDRLKEALVEGERLRAEVAASEGEARVARTLAQHLRSTAFEKWVLDEVVAQLVDGATEVLRQLSGGAYSLALDGAATFAVIDHANADARRLARTLSGGETFLASLALALALADRLGGFAADGAAPVDAIFLDEGFGSLDLETLDTVASAMENLAATGRVVGIVTHVPELAERVPVRFEVRRQGASSTVERVEG